MEFQCCWDKGVIPSQKAVEGQERNLSLAMIPDLYFILPFLAAATLCSLSLQSSSRSLWITLQVS